MDPPPVPQVGSQGIQRKSLLVCSCWNVRIDLGLQEAGDVPMGVLPPGTFLPDLPVSQGPVRAVRMGMGGVPSKASAPAATCAEAQSLACRHLVEDLLAANGEAPVSLPQLLSAMACLLPTLWTKRPPRTRPV